MNHDNQRFVDQLLDATLERFSSVEPRVGLEGRILAGVAARHQATERRRWAFALAASALAVVVVAVAVRIPRRPTAPASPNLRATVAQPADRPGKAAATPLKNPSGLSFRGGRRATDDEESRSAPGSRARFLASLGMTASREKRPRQFPTPTPLSEQEKLLLLYVDETPKSVLAALPVKSEADLEVPEVKIADLEIKDLPRLDYEK